MRTRALGLALAIGVLAAAGCGDQIAGPSGTTVITIRDNQFSPQTVIVERGRTIRWSNNGANIHNTVADNGAWTSGNLGPGETFSRTFGEAGTFAYRCSIHAGMTGTLIVD